MNRKKFLSEEDQREADYQEAKNPFPLRKGKRGKKSLAQQSHEYREWLEEMIKTGRWNPDKLEKPLLELSLYRLTLELDNWEAFNFLKSFFTRTMDAASFTKVLMARQRVIGVESRIRERVERDGA